MSAFEKLKSALAAYTGNTGPIEWSVVEREDGAGASLVASYSESLEVTDEPWTQFGGDEILALAGFDRCDGGMNSYQDAAGGNLVEQWAAVSDGDKETLWLKLQAAQKAEEAATAAHAEAEKLGSEPAYEAAFDAMAEARIKLQEAEEAYDDACAQDEE